MVKRAGALQVAKVARRCAPPKDGVRHEWVAYLLRPASSERLTVKHETLANLSA